MPTARIDEGLLVAFEIAQSRELTQFVKGIPQSIGVPEDYASLSMTCMYPEELGDRALSREERRVFPSLTRKIFRELSTLAIVGAELEPSYGEMVAYRDHASIVVDPAEVILEARSRVAEIVSKEMGIHLPRTNPRGWYVPIARREKKTNRLTPYKKPLPETLVISGATIAIRRSRGGNTRSIQSYVQKPRTRR